mgnify:FL=1
MSPPLSAADLVFMTSERLAEIVAASLAELAQRGDLALLDKAQAERIAADDDCGVWGEP